MLSITRNYQKQFFIKFGALIQLPVKKQGFGIQNSGYYWISSQGKYFLLKYVQYHQKLPKIIFYQIWCINTTSSEKIGFLDSKFWVLQDCILGQIFFIKSCSVSLENTRNHFLSNLVHKYNFQSKNRVFGFKILGNLGWHHRKRIFFLKYVHFHQNLPEKSFCTKKCENCPLWGGA